jgi:hypothetical protein
MDRKTLATHIDHTVLGPETTWQETQRVLDEAQEHGMNACIPPCYVDEAAAYASDVTLATVIGFPHGQNAPAAKRAEAATAADDGADELDVVINVGRLKAGDGDDANRTGASGEDDANRTGASGEEHGSLRAVVEMTLTYSGCPAREMLRNDVRCAALSAGVDEVEVRLRYSPSWNVNMVTEAGREDLREFGLSV